MIDKKDLIQTLSRGCKPPSDYLIGLEHEQFTFNAATGQPLQYEGSPGIKILMETLAERYGGELKYEGENPIALLKDRHSVTLEPAGQIELSGSPLASIDEVVAEHQNYQQYLAGIGEDLGIGFLSAGFHPDWKRSDMSYMPKARYKIMREYMPQQGDYGLDIMIRSCGAQLNLDFSNETDMVRKMRVSIALQPFITALFANSRKVEGKESGYASFRSFTWTDTDPDRCGILPFVFSPDMGFERYVEYLLDVPMILIEREGKTINMAGKSFRDFLKGSLPENEYYTPTIKDWEMHLGAAFPEVRLKQFLETRGTDSIPAPKLYALVAIWVGLLYDPDILDVALKMIAPWTIEDHERFRAQVAKDGMDTKVPQSNQSIGDQLPEFMDMVRTGLENQPSYQSGLAWLEIMDLQST